MTHLLMIVYSQPYDHRKTKTKPVIKGGTIVPPFTGYELTFYSIILVTTQAPTVLPHSLIANLRPSFIGIL